ncbi:MAG: 4Fe-4S dicluster domain-containing protein, partial [Candidatus Methylomirabilia bacterium]
KAVGAAFVPAMEPPRMARSAPPVAERRSVDRAIECIGCGMCLSACTMAAHNPRFPGPAALNRAFTLQADSRDTGQGERWPVLLSEDALVRCHGQTSCTEVCPMELPLTESILTLRRRAVARLF